MSIQLVIGCVVAVAVLALINILMFWSWRSINHIGEVPYKHLRQILKERRGGG